MATMLAAALGITLLGDLLQWPAGKGGVQQSTITACLQPHGGLVHCAAGAFRAATKQKTGTNFCSQK